MSLRLVRPASCLVVAALVLATGTAGALHPDVEEPGSVVARPDTFFVLTGHEAWIYEVGGPLENDSGYDASKHCLRRFDHNQEDGESYNYENTSQHGMLQGLTGCNFDGQSPSALHFIIRYRPPAGFEGVDSIRYCITEVARRKECISDIVDVSFVVGRVPIGASDDDYTTAAGHRLEVPFPGVLRNDQNGFASIELRPMIVGGPSHGSIELRRDGSFTYDPGDQTGVRSVDYCIVDSSAQCVSPTATVRLQVDPAVQPTAFDRSYSVPAETALVMCGPTDACGANVPPGAAYDVVMLPHNGTVTGGTSGPLVYRPNAGFVGQDDLTYCIDADPLSAACGESATNPRQSRVAVISITVTGTPMLPPPPAPPGRPHPVDDAYSTLRDGALVNPAPVLLENDSLGDADTVVLEVEPQHGALDLRSDGTFTYAPTQGFSGTDSFQYCLHETIEAPPPKVRQPHGTKKLAAAIGSTSTPAPRSGDVPCSSRSAIVRITVVDAEPPPDYSAMVAADDAYETPFDTPLDVPPAGVLANDALTGPTQAIATSKPAHGTLSQASDGSLRYEPDAGFTGVDTYNYCLAEPGATQCAEPPGWADDPTRSTTSRITATVTITVGAPVVPDDPTPATPPAPPPVNPQNEPAPAGELPMTGTATWLLAVTGCAVLLIGRNLHRLTDAWHPRSHR